MTELLIVGRGLAATTLMHLCQRNEILFSVIGSKNLSSSSRVAAGIYNPIVFKRMTKSWMADALIPELEDFYTYCEKILGTTLLSRKNILKPFADAAEENLWLAKSKNELDDFLDPKIYEASEAPAGTAIHQRFGKILLSGALNTKAFLDVSSEYFKDQILEETFDHSRLQINDSGIVYGIVKAKAIVFCEGWLVKENPFFNWVPLKPAKGEVLGLRIPGLALSAEILNAGSYFLETGKEEFKTGATYEWNELNETTSKAAREELLHKLKNHTTLNSEVISQEAGVRPATIDRRPVIGAHPKYTQVYIFNGLGTKGVMLAPYFGKKFVNFYLQNQKPGDEVNVSRFYHFYEEKTQGQDHRQA